MRKLALAAALALAAGLCSAIPAHAAGIQAWTALGRAVAGGLLNNEMVGRDGLKIAYRGKNVAASTVCFDKVRQYFIASAGNAGYSGGNGGQIRLSIQTLDVNDLPTGTVLGGTVTYSPGLTNGGLSAGQTVAGTLFKQLTFSQAPCLTAGQKFAIVYENIDPNQNVNYLGVDALSVTPSMHSAAVDPIWSVLMNDGTGGAWRQRETIAGYWDTPIFSLGRSSDNYYISHTYYESAGPQIIGGSTMALQQITPTSTVTPTTCYLMISRKTSAASPSIDVGFQQYGVGWLPGYPITVSLSSLPVDTSSGYEQHEVTISLPSTTLVASTGYFFRIGAHGAMADVAYLNPVKDGSPYFTGTNEAAGYGGTALDASWYDGSTWQTWPGDSARLSDLSFWCE